MILVRGATLADVPAIVAIHRSDIVTWKRWDADGQVHLADYVDLLPYERWLNGGPWMDESTYAPYLTRLLAPDQAGVALVAELDGQVRAAAEAWLGAEPAPFGHNLNLSVIYTLRGHAGRGLGSALIAALEARAVMAGCDSLMVSNAEAAGFYAKHGLARLETWRRARLPAKPSHTRYSAEPCAPDDYAVVRGWAMPVGRYQSARQEWERVRPGAEPRFEAWRGLRQVGWRLEVRNAAAVLWLEEVPRERGVADVHLWTPTPSLSRQLLAAIRDRGAQAGFNELMFFVAEAALPQLGVDWHDDGYKQHLWLKKLAFQAEGQTENT
jgi:GNAT superfamily N-acetyltransferase